MFLEEERPQNGSGDYQEDTGSEPTACRFRGVGIAPLLLAFFIYLVVDLQKDIT